MAPSPTGRRDPSARGGGGEGVPKPALTRGGGPARLPGPRCQGRRHSPPVSAGGEIRFQLTDGRTGGREDRTSRGRRRSRVGAHRLRPPCFHVSAAPAPTPTPARLPPGRRQCGGPGAGREEGSCRERRGYRKPRRALAGDHVSRGARTSGKCSPSGVQRFSTLLRLQGNRKAAW